MPIFISYSRQDREFVDKLVVDLVKRKHIIWIDQWEIKVGDSLLDKIQDALVDSSAIIVILSKQSVKSEWCKQELKAALTRQIKEKKTLVLPCVIEKCKMPLFLEDIFHANFVGDYERGFADLDKALDRVSNPGQGRISGKDYNVDWSVDWRVVEGHGVIDWCFIDHGEAYEMAVLSRCVVACNATATRNFRNALGADKHFPYFADVLDLILDTSKNKEIKILIKDAKEVRLQRAIAGKGGEEFNVVLTCRRMGVDIGMDTLMHFDNNLRNAAKYHRDVTYVPPGFKRK